MRLLVVGDYMIDESWTTGIHRSLTARRTGRVHCRSLNSPQSATQALAGAGLTASLLHRTLVEDQPGTPSPCFEVTGLGYWHPEDTDIVRGLHNPASAASQTPYRLSRRSETTEEYKPNLINLAEIPGSWGEGPSRRVEYDATTRAIRVYAHAGAGLDLIERIDWELNTPFDEAPWNRDPSKLEDQLKSLCNPDGGSIAAIVVNDLTKGVVTPTLVGLLASVFKDVPWYILSKRWPLGNNGVATWFEEIADKRIELLVLPGVAAESAVRDGVLPCWISDRCMPTKEALERMRQLQSLTTHAGEPPLIVVLPRTQNVVFLGRKESPSQEDGILVRRSDSDRCQVFGDVASVLFAAMTATLLSNKGTHVSQQELLSDSLQFASQWLRAEAERIALRSEAEGDRPRKKKSGYVEVRLEFRPVDSCRRISVKDHPLPTYNYTTFACDKCLEQWNSALTQCGVVNDQLQLWRAMTLVDGYVHVTEPKKLAISSLLDGLRSFNPAEGRSRSYMLIAAPGSGKTTLIRRLADTLHYRTLPFNLTRMTSETDILDCLDTIVTEQSTLHSGRLLVFIDEINSKVAGHTVYSSFLSPMEEGLFVRAGRTVSIQPCVWIFADTKDPRDDEDSLPSKATDFCSRLTLEPLDLGIPVAAKRGGESWWWEVTHLWRGRQKEIGSDGNAYLADSQRVENVYLGVCLLRSTFPDIQWVSTRVLRLFRAFSACATARDIRHFVESFSGIQYGRVTAMNVPKDWIKRHKRLVDDEELNVYERETDRRLIEVVE